MDDDEQDEISYEKILEAAREISGMAQSRPAEASALLAQARHLMELAEQIRSDWLRRRGIPLGGIKHATDTPG